MRQALHAFLGDRRGSTITIFALALPALVGFAGLGVEAANWYVSKRQLQNAADLSAMAAAIEIQRLPQGTDGSAHAQSTVRTEVERNGVNVAKLTSFVVNVPPLSGPNAGNTNAVEVILRQPLETHLSALFISGNVEAGVRATARADTDRKYCILALSTTAREAINFTGSANANLGCAIASNSRDARSIAAEGSARVRVSAVRSSGGVSNSGGLVSESDPVTYANAVKDPYTDLAVPRFTSCDHNNFRINKTSSLSPGTYCNGIAVEGTASVTLEPGVYIIAGGEFGVRGTASLTGRGVTIILTNRDGGPYARLRFEGEGNINLTAATTGPYANVLIFQDPRAPLSNETAVRIRGGSGSDFQGAIHIPNRSVELTGGASASGCLHVVAQTVTFTGSFSVPRPCDDPTFRRIGDVKVALVE